MSETPIQMININSKNKNNYARINLTKDNTKEFFCLTLSLDDFSFKGGKEEGVINPDSLNTSDLNVIKKCLNDAYSTFRAETHEIKNCNFKITRFEMGHDRDTKISFKDKEFNKERVTMEFYGQVSPDDEYAISSATSVVSDRLLIAIDDIREESLMKRYPIPKDTADLKM